MCLVLGVRKSAPVALSVIFLLTDRVAATLSSVNHTTPPQKEIAERHVALGDTAIVLPSFLLPSTTVAIQLAERPADEDPETQKALDLTVPLPAEEHTIGDGVPELATRSGRCGNRRPRWRGHARWR